MRVNQHPADEFVTHRINLRSLGEVGVFAFRPSGPVDNRLSEPLAVCYGAWRDSDRPPLLRLQSKCMYGEVLYSTDCDCREQLDLAMEQMRLDGAGVVVYLDQEGRNAGQINKALGYEYAQQHHVDSFTAYQKLGLEPDSRDYARAGELLTALGIRRARLLTNNPQKLAAMEKYLDRVERQELWLEEPSVEASSYIRSKLRRGHLRPQQVPDPAWALQMTPAAGITGLGPVQSSGVKPISPV